MQADLDLIKSADIRLYASFLGYTTDRRDNMALRNAAGEKLVVKLHGDGNWGYWNPGDDRDRGTLIDLVMSRKGMTKGEAIRELKGWFGMPAPAIELPKAEPVVKDLASVQEEWRGMRNITQHRYLQAERGIPIAVLSSWRWKGRIREDSRRNAVFAHFNRYGDVCGYELRNYKFKGFAKGGERGLFASKESPNDNELVVSESGVKSLAYASIYDTGRMRYHSTAGPISAMQKSMLARAIGHMPEKSGVTAARDNDAAGDRWQAKVEEAFAMADRPDMRIFVQHPAYGQKDFGDELIVRRMRPEIGRKEMVP